MGTHVSDPLAMNIFSCYNSTKSTFFYPRYRLQALKKGSRRHQLLLPLGTPNNVTQFPTVPHCISEGQFASEDEDDDGGSMGLLSLLLLVGQDNCSPLPP